MSNYGDTFYSSCPICEGSDIESRWRIPFHRASENSRCNGFAVQYFPSYGGTTTYEYFGCANCESVFLNPYSARRKSRYASRDNSGAATKIAAADDRMHASWNGYRARSNAFIMPYIPSGAKTIVDAACGGGQHLILVRENYPDQIERLIGLEISPLAVDHIRSLGFDGHECDLDSLEEDYGIEPGIADFVIFSEAFEHVEFPHQCMSRLTGLLRPGGRLFFSAQRIDEDLPIRPGENHCVSEPGLNRLIESLNCRPILIKQPPGKWICVIERI